MKCIILILLSLAAFIYNVKALDTEGLVSRANEARPVKYLVTIKRDDKPICRGGIIGSWIVLTVATCVYDKKSNDFISGSLSIIAGSGSIKADVETIYVPKVFSTESNATLIGDIAVLKLKQNLKIQDNSETLQRLVTPRETLGIGYRTYSNERVKIASYDHERNITLPNLMDAKVIDDSECVARTGEEVDKTQLCSKIQDNGYGSLRLCELDRGSPLVFDNKVIIGIALVSSDQCVINGEPSVYTRVSSYQPFIRAARYGKSMNALVKVIL